MAFSQIYNHDHPTLYPLIYFDALYVVFRKLTQIREKLEDRKLDEAIFDIADAYSSFAKRAIEANNASGAALAVLSVWRTYKELKEAGLDRIAHDVNKELVGTGILAAANKSKLGKNDLTSGYIHEWIIDQLSDSGEDIEGEVVSSYIRYAFEIEYGYDDAWAFIRTLGNRMRTNFGLNFDPSTGETVSS